MTGALLTVALQNLVLRGWLPPDASLVALVPLFRALTSARGVRHAIGTVSLASVGVSLPAFEGVLPAIPWSLPLAMGAYAFVLSPVGLLFVAVRRRLGLTASLALLPVVWIACEFVSSQWWLWRNYANPVSIGYLQASGTLMPVASVLGVRGVGLLLLGVNALVTAGLLRLEDARAALRLTAGAKSTSPRGATGAFCLAGVLMMTPLLVISLSNVREPVPSTDDSDVVRVGVVQPVADPVVQLAAESWSAAAEFATASLLEISFPALEGVDLVVWPEGALPAPFASGTPDWQAVVAPDLLSGSVLEVEGRRVNSVVQALDGPIERVFDKISPVPIGEAGISAGSRLVVGDWGGGELGVLVCLDSLHPVLARRVASFGAQAILVLSDDSFAAAMVTPYLHLMATAFRAVETGLPVLFASASGPSALILPDGSVQPLLGKGTRGTAVAEVPLSDSVTPFVKLGDLVGPGCGSVTMLLAGLLSIGGLRPARSGVSA